MCEALSDKNKLVRWRAARFLAEVGSAASLPALQAKQNDPEFEGAFRNRNRDSTD